ncbi:Manganese transport system ATP-binding protein MntB [Chlamydiales bacterium SCGC AB-751-O23]|jgi:manganese/zinc/iron transport system ATP- binding protein|nr:Manganese transport system ATP-binding protein MntB [Chlamydiales bacterium SCGC AB-751-O23]
MKNSSIQVENLTVNYDCTPVLWGLNFEIPTGQLVGIIGPNGAGKSTLLKTLLGLITPITGSIDFMGKTLKDFSGLVAYVPQRESVDWDFPISVIELVIMGCYAQLGLFKQPGKAEKKKALALLERVEMQNFADRQIDQLSGGQQQRVFFARSLMQEAQVYFLDEPFSGIDKKTEDILFRLLQELKNEGKSIFVVHHDLTNIQKYFDWVVMLNMSLIAVGEVKTVFNEKNLQKTFGKGFAILEEVAKLSQKKNEGIAP